MRFSQSYAEFSHHQIYEYKARGKNPDKGDRNYLKRGGLGNVSSPDLEHLSNAITYARERLRHKREVIRSYARQCGYSV